MKNKISSYKLIFVTLIILSVSCNKIDKPPAPVSDTEGNTYKTVKIGTQIWMAESLRTTRYNDDTEIELVTDDDSWRNLTTGGYSWYNNQESEYKNPYGALYNGFAVSTGKLCPSGWHVPILEEWQLLIDYLGDTINGGGKLKEVGTTHWHSPNKGADNSSGFTALAAGIRYHEGTFRSVLFCTCFWLASENNTFDLWYSGLNSGDALLTMNHRSKKTWV